MENVSSEQELLAMRQEGKISEEEYRQLRDAMNASSDKSSEKPEPVSDKAKSKRKLGLIAFCLMLAGFILPIIFLLILRYIVSVNNNGTDVGWFGLGIILSIALEIAAFVMGLIAWPDVFAKATVITSSILLVIMLLFTT